MKRTLVFGMLLGCSGADEPVEMIKQAQCSFENECCPGSPIVIDVAGDGVHLTGWEEGVQFALKPGYSASQISWTAAGSDDAWLVFDRDGDGFITSGAEMFGNFAPQQPTAEGEKENGFRALAELDENDDGRVDASDPQFAWLRLWQDTNHDGISQPEELSLLSKFGIVGLSTVYATPEPKVTDPYGNRFRYSALVYTAPGSTVGSIAWDVWLTGLRPALLIGKPTPQVPCWRCTAHCPIRAKPGSGWQDSQCWYANGGSHNIDAIGPILKTYDPGTACLAAIQVCQQSLSSPATCELYGSGCPVDIVAPPNCHTVTCPVGTGCRA